MSSVRSQVHGHNISQDVQLQVIIGKNENDQRIQGNNRSMQKATKTTQNMCSEFCIEPQMITNEDILSKSNPAGKSSENRKYLECPFTINSASNLILSKHLKYFWKYLKWPLSLCFLCILIGFVAYTCVRALKNHSFVRNCLNSSSTYGCSTSNMTVPHSESTFYDNGNVENSRSSESNKTITNENVTEPIFDGSPTILRPLVLPHSLQADFTERNNILDNNSKNDYGKILKQLQNYEDRFNSGKNFEKSIKSESETETRGLLGFTSGHQNFFGVPTGEDERMLRLINEELMKLEKQTETSKMVESRTEGTFAVSPTVPSIFHHLVETSGVNSAPSDDTQCQSTSLPMCRGVLPYDLTSSKSRNSDLKASDLKSFEQLFASNCSIRAAEFVCTLLEPECRPEQYGFLQPCKRFCKSILEACSNLVVNSDVLTYIFDCDKYPASDNKNVCEDPTRRNSCFENEFKCQDMTCIPKQWQCDNIKDCSTGEDELGCIDCNPEEFRCKSNEKCLPNELRCDTNNDCADGSDEFDCSSETDEFDPQPYPRMFSFTSFLLPNQTVEKLFSPVQDDRLAYASELNESQVVADVSSDEAPASTNLGGFQDTKEIMMTSDSENKFKISQSHNSTQEADSKRSCSEHELRCVSGMCITVDQLCDKIKDCAGGEDELSCAYEERSEAKDP